MPPISRRRHWSTFRGSSRPCGRSAIAEKSDPAGSHPLLARLALAYAPATTRADWAALFALDARLAGIVRSAREPMLAQLRLAWWRDRFTGSTAEWPRGEPLLASLSAWGGELAGLSQLVDGWEALLGEAPLPLMSLEEFSLGRAAAAQALARRQGADPHAAGLLARRWALADLALHTSHPDEREAAARLHSAAPPPPRAAAALRPLGIMAGLTSRAVERGQPEALSGPSALLAAVRIGLFGR